jgi:hypothetical protein
MRLHRLALAALLLAPAALRAQASTSPAPVTPAPSAAEERAAVLAVVKAMFDGMRAGDSAAVRAVFHPQAQLSTTRMRNGQPAVEMDSIAGFLRAVGTPHEDVWDERTHDEDVRVDGAIAQAWTPYEFWAGEKFSHCGVNAFTLARTADGWKVIALVDTRRRTGCRGNATVPAAPPRR